MQPVYCSVGHCSFLTWRRCWRWNWRSIHCQRPGKDFQVRAWILLKDNQLTVHSLTSSLAVLPTVTVTPSSAPTACFLDQAGCPNINNTTYISSTTPAHTFLQICETNIISKTGESIDISGTIQLSWKACMDSCADYNTNVKQGGCQGATWQMFSSTNPSNNSVCTLKSSAQFTTGQASSEQLCSGILLS